MSEGLISWNTADYLRSKDDVCLYLEAAAEEDPGDGSLLRVALNNIVQAQHIGNLSGEIKAACDSFQDALSEPDGLSLVVFIRFISAMGMRLHLSLPLDLEERLSNEQGFLAKQGSQV